MFSHLLPFLKSDPMPSPPGAELAPILSKTGSIEEWRLKIRDRRLAC